MIHRIPEIYRWSSIRTKIHLLPEVDRLIPTLC